MTGFFIMLGMFALAFVWWLIEDRRQSSIDNRYAALKEHGAPPFDEPPRRRRPRTQSKTTETH